jgi:putative oxidoreductase
MKFGMALVRTMLGGLMIGHGTQKLFGWFGGYGPEGTGQFFESLGLRPGKRNALAAGAAEAGGGALLALGLLTPLGGAALTGSMATAIATVHAPRGPWVTDGGWEYNAVIIAAAAAITDAGPGDWSLDALHGRSRWGSGWALAQLAAGGLGAVAAIALGRAAGGPEPAPPAAEQPPAGTE